MSGTEIRYRLIRGVGLTFRSIALHRAGQNRGYGSPFLIYFPGPLSEGKGVFIPEAGDLRAEYPAGFRSRQGVAGFV